MDSKRTKTRSPSLVIWKNPSLEARSLHKDERCKHKQQHAPMHKELSRGQNNSHPNRRIHFNKREPQEIYTARHLYLPDTHAALFADNLCSYQQADSRLQRTEMAMLIWRGKPINSSLRTARWIICDIPKRNAFLLFRSRWTKSTLSTTTKRRHLYERGVVTDSTPPPYTVTRTQSSELQTRDSSFSRARHQSVRISRHRIGASSTSA